MDSSWIQVVSAPALVLRSGNALSACAECLITCEFVIVVRIPSSTRHRRFFPLYQANWAGDRCRWCSEIWRKIRSRCLSSGTSASSVWCRFGRISLPSACTRRKASRARCQRCRICPFDRTRGGLPTFRDMWNRRFEWSGRNKEYLVNDSNWLNWPKNYMGRCVRWTIYA